MKSTLYTISTTAVLIRAAQPEPETIYLSPQAQDIYIGGSDVTDATGIQLTKSVITPIFVRGEQTLYAIGKTGSHPLIILSESP